MQESGEQWLWNPVTGEHFSSQETFLPLRWLAQLVFRTQIDLNVCLNQWIVWLDTIENHCPSSSPMNVTSKFYQL